MTSNNYFITAPIFYVNDVPHIGHAYTSIVSDVICRFMRLSGKNVKYLTGTDEHGQKVEESAHKREVDPQIFVDQNAQSFQRMMKELNIDNDDFIRTTEARHKASAVAFWKKLESTGNIYLDKYSGWYSVRDEAYYSESELTPEGLAPTGASVKWLEEDSYFFPLSKWQDKLLEHYENNPDFILPKSRRNEVISFVEGGLKDLSISRSSFTWGIKVPGDEKHIMYVWLDALVNYISALGYPKNTEDFQAYWPAHLHIVGKDILRFHAVYWPAFLMAAGLELPKTIMAHGWWTNNGEKISKSLGNVINPLDLVEKFGVDPMRYFLIRGMTFGNDGNYSNALLISRNNTELANKIGNLFQRVNAFVYKRCEQQTPIVSSEYIDYMYDLKMFKYIDSVIKDNEVQIQSFNINKILDNVLSIAEEANVYMDQEAPWALYQSNPEKMNQVLFTLLEVLRYIGIMMQPFTPDSADKMLNSLNVPKEHREFCNLTKEFAIKPQCDIPEPQPIFRRID